MSATTTPTTCPRCGQQTLHAEGCAYTGMGFAEMEHAEALAAAVKAADERNRFEMVMATAGTEEGPELDPADVDNFCRCGELAHHGRCAE